MCNEAVVRIPYTLACVPDQYMTQEICYEAMGINLAAFFIVSVHFKTKGMPIKAVEVDTWQLESVPDQFKTLEMCDKTVREDPFCLQYVPDWFVTQQQVKIWLDDHDRVDDDEIIEWYNDYKKLRAQKAQIKKELMVTAWHPLRWWDWCVPGDESKQTEKLWK